MMPGYADSDRLTSFLKRYLEKNFHYDFSSIKIFIMLLSRYYLGWYTGVKKHIISGNKHKGQSMLVILKALKFVEMFLDYVKSHRNKKKFPISPGLTKLVI